jgi:galactarate dehydratase (D-threo-forming)
MLKIQRLQLFPIVSARETGITNQHVVVRLETSNEVGWGEMSDLSHVPMYQFDVPELERTLNELLRGRDALNLNAIEDDLIRFYPDEGHMYSRSGLVRQGIDLALHDLLGRHYGVPVHTLLGGQLRDRIQVCFPVFRMRSPDQVEPNLQRVEAKLNEGFDLIRVYVGANTQVDELFLRGFSERFAGRAAIKSLDFSNLLDWRRALSAAERFGEFGPFMLLESVAPRDDFDGLAEFRRRSRWPISEHVQHLSHAWQLTRLGCVDILNISPYVLGGLRASLRVIAVAEAAHASVLIGTTQELSLGTAAVAHLGAVARVLDYPSDSTGPRLYKNDVVKTSVQYERGHLVVPTTAGLGVDIDEDLLRHSTSKAHWTFGVDLRETLDRTPAVGTDPRPTADSR